MFGNAGAPPPRAFISPSRYVQGPGVLDRLGTYIGLVGTFRPGVLASPGRIAAVGSRIERSLKEAGASPVFANFGGECSFEEIDARKTEFAAQQVDALIAFGGGKCIDAGKSIAHRLDVPIIVAPSLASNDAPCSALSVVYTPAGAVAAAEFLPNSPALVIVDSQLVAEAPARYLVAGMGDAMATWYEARAVGANPHATTTIGGAQTRAAAAIGEACAQTLFDSGVQAAAAVQAGRVDQALEDVIEANTLLSGIGFESGGLAIAHAVASALPDLPAVEHAHLHGEMVAIGTLVQLKVEGDQHEEQRVTSFFAEVGLPTSLKEISIDPEDSESVDIVVESSMGYDFIHNSAGRVTGDVIRKALTSLIP